MQTSLGGSLRNLSVAERKATPFLDVLGTSERVVALRDEVRKEGLPKHIAIPLEIAKAKGVILRGTDQRWVVDDALFLLEKEMLISVESRRKHRSKIRRIIKGEEVDPYANYASWMKLPPLTDSDPEAPTEELFLDDEIRRYFRKREHFEDFIKSGDLSIAELALNYYNNNNKHAMYELTETLGICMHQDVDITYYHGNFYARPIQGCSDSSTKLFFAEVASGGRGHGSDLKPGSKFVCILDDDSNRTHGSKTAHGCSFCPQIGAAKLAHPVTGYHGAPLTADHRLTC